MSDHSELKKLLEACKESNCADASDFGRRIADLYDYLDPETVAEMVAENEKLNAIAYGVHGAFRMETMQERDQFKAENEALRKALTYIRDTSDDWHVCEKAADALKDSKDAG